MLNISKSEQYVLNLLRIPDTTVFRLTLMLTLSGGKKLLIHVSLY